MKRPLSLLSSSSCFRFYPQGPVEVAPHPPSPHPRGKAGIGSPWGWGWKETLHKTFALLCAALRVRVAGVLGADLQWNLGTQRVSTKDVFWLKPFFFGTTRESRCCYRNSFERWLKSSRELQVLHYCLLFKSTTFLSGPLVCPAHRVTEPPALPGRAFSVTVQYAPGSSFPLSRASGRLVGLAGVPQLSGRAPLFCRTPWHSRGADTRSQALVLFSPPCSEHLRERLLSLCNIDRSGLEINLPWKKSSSVS